MDFRRFWPYTTLTSTSNHRGVASKVVEREKLHRCDRYPEWACIILWHGQGFGQVYLTVIAGSKTSDFSRYRGPREVRLVVFRNQRVEMDSGRSSPRTFEGSRFQVLSPPPPVLWHQTRRTIQNHQTSRNENVHSPTREENDPDETSDHGRHCTIGRAKAADQMNTSRWGKGVKMDRNQFVDKDGREFEKETDAQFSSPYRGGVTVTSPIRLSPTSTFANGESPSYPRQYTRMGFANRRELTLLAPMYPLSFRLLANVRCTLANIPIRPSPTWMQFMLEWDVSVGYLAWWSSAIS